jgi:hypothetical protein
MTFNLQRQQEAANLEPSERFRIGAHGFTGEDQRMAARELASHLATFAEPGQAVQGMEPIYFNTALALRRPCQRTVLHSPCRAGQPHACC